eukprot:1003262-Pyramimonas_sp.AAC.1
MTSVAWVTTGMWMGTYGGRGGGRNGGGRSRRGRKQITRWGRRRRTTTKRKRRAVNIRLPAIRGPSASSMLAARITRYREVQDPRRGKRAEMSLRGHSCARDIGLIGYRESGETDGGWRIE